MDFGSGAHLSRIRKGVPCQNILPERPQPFNKIPIEFISRVGVDHVPLAIRTDEAGQDMNPLSPKFFTYHAGPPFFHSRSLSS